MNTQEALQFIHRLLSCAQNNGQAHEMLNQLRAIIDKRLGENPDLKEAIALIDKAIVALSESMAEAKASNCLTKESLELAHRRYMERIERERYMQRC